MACEITTKYLPGAINGVIWLSSDYIWPSFKSSITTSLNVRTNDCDVIAGRRFAVREQHRVRPLHRSRRNCRSIGHRNCSFRTKRKNILDFLFLRPLQIRQTAFPAAKKMKRNKTLHEWNVIRFAKHFMRHILQVAHVMKQYQSPFYSKTLVPYLT